MKGAEIALVGGRRIRIGSGDDCDIILADASVPSVACELDVSDTAVMLLEDGKDARTLTPFEIQTFGTSALALGPADEPWQPLHAPRAEEPAPKQDDASPPAKDEPIEAPPPVAGLGESKPKEKSARRSRGCLWGLFLLLLLVLVLGALWFWWPQITARYPFVESWRVTSVEKTTQLWNSYFASEKPVVEPVAPAPTLRELADQYHLTLTEDAGVSKLTGNVRRRTERLAIRALALARDPRVVFDLTDDETLLSCARELLFVVTEGDIKATAASNRVVTLTGRSPSREDFEEVVRALYADVRGLGRLETKGVLIDETLPVIAPTKEIVVGKKNENALQLITPPTPKVRAKNEPKVMAPTKAKAKATPAKREYAIAGILMKPYPCVVMRSGLRLAEGAHVGKATIVRIEADCLILQEGQTQFTWRP